MNQGQTARRLERVEPHKGLVMRLCSVVLSLLVVAGPASAAERLDLVAVTKIRDEGFRRSQVMEVAHALTDTIGPRLTGSPNAKRANELTRRKLADWGLSNVHLEAWGPFGRGWSYEFATVRMLEPDVSQMVAIPKAWTPGTEGTKRARVVRIQKLEGETDFQAHRGKLAGKIVFLGETPTLKPHDQPLLKRHDAKSLEQLANYVGVDHSSRVDEWKKQEKLRESVNQFLHDEKAVAVVVPGKGGDGGTFDVQEGGSFKLGDPLGIPLLVMATEHFGRIDRLIAHDTVVELAIDVRARFHQDDPMGYNTIAELPGTDKKHELVMLGAHLDSWHGGTGATDNAAGVAAVMEAMRILKASGVRPRRTIRVALWTGEEQGLLGSSAYIEKHFAKRPVPKEPEERDLPSWAREKTGPLTFRPGYRRLSAYFNLDNGTGRIRGIYAQGNAAARPIFERWLEPLRDLGVTTVTMRSVSNTDHVSFDAVGLPGFQFIQDEVEYVTRSHHSNMDVYERLQSEDLIQAAIVIATFAYHAAISDEMFPRKPLPKPAPTKPHKPL